MAVQKEIMAEDKRKKWNQWAEVLWNIILIVGCMYFFCRLLADMNESGFARMAAENRILLPVLGMFLLSIAAPAWKNIQKLGACDEQGGSAPEKEAEERRPYLFMDMYRRVVRHRLFILFFFPAALCIVWIAAAYILFPDSVIFGTASWFYRFVRSLCEIAGVLLVPCLFLSVRVYIAKERNMERLHQVYRSADEEEVRAVDNIREGSPAFVITKEYLVNWDGSLHIIPLKEIETIMYKDYFYLLIYGTKLVVRDRRGKTYTIWTCGPSSRDWAERGFVTVKGRHNDRHLERHCFLA